MAIANKNKTHCIHGHEYTVDNTRRDARGYRSCKACKHAQEKISKKKVSPTKTRVWAATYYSKNRVRSLLTVKRCYVLREYGISLEQYNALLKSQNNICALCKQPFIDSEKKCLDHCHVTKQVREFLHDSCNRALGIFKDSPEICRLAAQYLEKHKEIEMFQSQDGSKHGSRFVARKKDEMHSLGAKQENSTPEHEDINEPQEEEKEQVENPQEIVKKHGAAHTIHLKHNHVSKRHHVTSQHEDGTTKESEHGSADEAHKHASALAGVQAQPSHEEGLETGGEQMGMNSPEGLA